MVVGAVRWQVAELQGAHPAASLVDLDFGGEKLPIEREVKALDRAKWPVAFR